MEEKNTRLGNALEKFEVPVNEQEWASIANDPAVVRYGKRCRLRRVAIYGSAVLFVAVVVATVVLMNRPAKAKVAAQVQPQENIIQNASATPVAEQEKVEETLIPENVNSSTAVKSSKTQSLAPVASSESSSKLMEPVVDKIVAVQSDQQKNAKPNIKTVKQEQKPTNLKNIANSNTQTSSSSKVDKEDLQGKNEIYSESEPEDNYKLYIPNAFTPNGDGLNDLFTISANFTPVQFECTIFSRRGERVFYSKSMDTPWDGTKNGSVMPQNVYVYMIKYTDPTGKQCVEKGQVTLLLN